MAARNHKKIDSEQIQRFGLQFRIQHGVLMLSVVTLIVTGILLWCLARPDYIWWSRKFYLIEIAQWLHRIAGSVLLILSLYHLIYMSFTREGRKEFWNLLPRWKDVTDLMANLAWFLHLRKSPPRFDRFTYYEKFDYWAVYWGSVIMIATGLVLWFDRFSAKYLPWFPYKLASEVHADEAILAALAIFIWHFYNVHYKPEKFPGSGTWIHGRISKEEMLKFHSLEYERMTAREKDEDSAK